MIRIHLVILSILFSCCISFAQNQPITLEAYADTLEKFRTGKNIKLLYSDSSPLKPEQLKNFEGLNYFPADLNFLVEANLSRDTTPQTVIMRTTTERAPEYIRYGTVTFELAGKVYSLSAYQSKKLLEVKNNETTLFIPFRDETNGNETYKGGRYVDCEIPTSGDRLTVDFNKAYNPYCAYNPRYSCVIPPEENRLGIRIEAGEKIFEKH
jgi:uncharacterized protein (DUF1684 family)